MEDNFLNWHELKSTINSKENKVLFQEQEIWWCSVGRNIGEEENGKNTLFERPVLVLRKFSHQTFLGIPLSSRKKSGRYYFIFFFAGKSQTALLSQLRIFSAKRLNRKMGKLGDGLFDSVKEVVICLIKDKSSAG